MTDNVAKMTRASKATKKSRTVMSCDRCKSRKTKCNKPSMLLLNCLGCLQAHTTDFYFLEAAGPCDYCRSINVLCQFDPGKRRQKPYYFVSEEEYRLLQQVCEHYVPNQNLDISALRSLVSQFAKPPAQGNTQIPTQPYFPATETPTDRFGHDSDANHPLTERHGVSLQEIVDLHEDLGCMLADSHGEYRYMGAESGISFNSAVRSWTCDVGISVKNKIIPPLIAATMPVAKLSASESPSCNKVQLPSKDFFSTCASRYFEEVHCVYWLYSSEEFYARLEATYSEHERLSSDSWICSINSITALGALYIARPEILTEEQHAVSSLELAKSLVPKVCDEADLDSVRALMLLTLALQSHGFSNSAYLHIGLATRIAFSLGLHLDGYSSNHGRVATEHARRLWWSLFLLDQDIALRLGKPSMSGFSPGKLWQQPLLSEQIVSPGPHMPQGYLKITVGLAQLTKETCHKLYTGPINEGEKLTLLNFDEAMSSLRQWFADIPPHLSATAPTPPSYRRAVALLHLRYWSIIILITRPFLLSILLRRKQLENSPKLKHFDELANTCIGAAEESLAILEDMERSQMLSSLILTDFLVALELLQIFLIASALRDAGAHQEQAKSSLHILQAIGSFGSPKRLLPEIIFQFQKTGISNIGQASDSTTKPFQTSNLSTESGIDLFNMIFDPGNDFDLRDISLTDIDQSEGALNGQIMEQLLEISGNFPARIV